MKEKIPTPTCEVSGLPLPVRRTEPPNGAQFSFYDYHHHFHPKRDPLLEGESGKALRVSRGQLMPRALHDNYHEIFNGPPLPTTLPDRYRLCVLACAGVVPRKAIDVSQKGEYRVISLSDDEHALLSSPTSIFIEQADKPAKEVHKRIAVGKFFAAYALRQNIKEVVSDKVIDEFLDQDTGSTRKKELGNLILKEALGITIGEVLAVHSAAKEEGLVLPNARYQRLGKVVRSFFTIDRFPQYYSLLSRKLAA